MNIFDRILGRFGYRKQTALRAYTGAKTGRLVSDWGTATSSANKEIRDGITSLRARSRDLERNNDYARRYLAALENNVLGSGGIKLQAKSKDINGQLDTLANAKVEEAFKAWGRAGVCSVDGRQSWLDIQRLVLRSVARDGAVLVRKVRNWRNDYRFALQVMEIDHLDHEANGKLKNGNTVRMGVECDEWGAPVAYHILANHSGDDNAGKAQRRERVPADEIIQPFMAERPHQVTGAPWMASSMFRLNQLAAYEEAEVVGARISSCKMGFYTKSEASEVYQGEADAQGNMVMNAEPGAFEELPVGTDFKTFDPQHPSTAYSSFIKGALRGIASGLNVSYNSLANDLEGVNYSSIRAGLLEEREHWKAIQIWFIDHVVEPVFREWLQYALLANAIDLPAAKFDKFASVEWRPRRWQWVDPLKDTQANVIAVANGFKSRRAIIAEAGGDIEDTFTELATDEKLAEAKGIKVDPMPTTAPTAVDEGQSDDEPTAVDDERDEAAPLNGAQVTAALSVIEQVTAGQMPAMAAEQLLAALGIDDSQVATIMGSVAKFKPRPATD